MAVSLTSTNKLSRALSFTLTSDWSIAGYFQVPTTISADYVTIRGIGDLNLYTDPYIYFGSPAISSDHVIIETFDGSTVTTSSQIIITPGTFYYYSLQYNSTTHTLSLYLGTKLTSLALATSISVNLSTFVFVSTTEYLLGDDTGNASNTANGEYDRVWQTLLTLGQLDTEKLSITAVVTGNLISDTRVAGQNILTDSSGNGHTWTKTGTLGYADGPLPPTNTTPATAIDITSLLNYSTTLDVQDAPKGTGHVNPKSTAQNNEIWFKFTPTLGNNALGINFDNTLSGFAVYEPAIGIWKGTNPSSLTLLKNTDIAWSGTIYAQVGLEVGFDYYIQVIGMGSYPLEALDAELIFNAVRAPATAWVAGDLIIPNDTINGPSVIIDQFTGQAKNIYQMPANEQASILPSGVMLIAAENSIDAFIHSWDLYSDPITKILSIIQPVVGNWNLIGPITNDWNATFYIALRDSTNPAKIYQITSVGAVGSNWTLPSNSQLIASMAITKNGHTLYYATETNNEAIFAFDLIGNVALPNLVAAPGATKRWGRDIYIDANNDIIVMCCNNTVASTWEIRRYNSSGTLQATYTLGSSTGTAPRMSLTADGLFINAMTFSAFGNQTTVHHITIATGVSVNTTFTQKRGTGSGDGIQFGPAQSCPLLTIMVTVPGESGIYQIVPNKRDDTYYSTGVVKIPDPYIITGLLGG